MVPMMGMSNEEVLAFQRPGETFSATAVETGGAEHDRVFQVMTTELTRFADYQDTVERVIPLFRLTRSISAST